MLHAENLALRFGETVALVDASATVPSASVTAIVGPSGSGKSTMLHCMAGLLRPDRGRVLFDGEDITTLDDNGRSDLRRVCFGFVFQFAQLVPELSLRENIALPLELGGVPRSARRRRVDELIDRFDLASHANRRPTQVSGGQAQRAAVARAMASPRRVLFADEPTGALDSDTGRVVLTSLIRLAKEDGTAVVLVTHDPGVAEHADRILGMQDGITLGERQ